MSNPSQPTAVRTVAIVCSDVFFRAQIRDACTAADLVPVAWRVDAPLPEGCVVLVADLGDARLDAIGCIRAARGERADLPVVAFASHVRDDLLAAGRAAGVDRVVPRSNAMAALRKLLASSSAGS